jgi:hypothetical protein
MIDTRTSTCRHADESTDLVRQFKHINVGAQDAVMRHSNVPDTKTDVAEPQRSEVDVLDVVRERPFPRRAVLTFATPSVLLLVASPRLT